MRRFELETVQMRQVTWDAGGVRTWTLRRKDGGHHPAVELEHGRDVLRMGVRELLLLREAIDVLMIPLPDDDDVSAPPRSEKPARAGKPRPPKPARAGQPWTDDDERLLAERHAAGEAPKAIAARLERTPASVEARLVKLGLIPPRPDGWRALQVGPAPRAPGPDEPNAVA